MPEKIESGIIRDDAVRNFLYHLEKWALATGKDRTTRLEMNIWDHAVSHSAVKDLIKKFSAMEDDIISLSRAEEHIRRLERGCYGKCIHYARRDGETAE